MAYPISEDFSDPQGRWDEVAPWDGTEHSDSSKGFLATQQHVDLRAFRVLADLVAVPQTTLNAEQQSVLDAEPQTSLEQAVGVNTLNENWTLTATTGTNNDLVVGKQAAYGGWSGAKFTCNGTALHATLESVITQGIDISAQDSLSIVFPDHITFDGTSYVQLCSGGAFGAGHDSLQVAFSTNTVSLPELRVPLSAFAQLGFDSTNVTGIRIHFDEVSIDIPAAGTAIYTMAIRAVKSTWVASALDFDTRLGAAVVPVTLDGHTYAGTVAENFEYVRGDLTKNDPIPADVGINMFFYPGGEVANDATGSNYNKLSAIFREIKDSSAGTGSHIEVSLKFNNAATNFEVKRVDSTGGSPGTTTDHGVYTESIGGALDPAKHYVFRAEVKGTRIIASLYETDINHVVGNFVWHLASTLSDSNYTYRNGRVGFIASFLTKDAYLDEIVASPTGYAHLTSEVFAQRTPVDGAQLSAVYSADENLWQSYTGTDILIDQTKTLSGGGSYRTSKGLTSNTFVVDDWTQSYLDVAIWVPSNVTLKNQPIILLNTSSGTENIVLPRLQPAQWNELHLDLGIFRNLLTGTGYSFSILPATDPDKPLGNFWVDSTVLGRRRVAWSVRATSTGLFRQFRDLVNNSKGAVHFPSAERGTALQIRAEALTEDAWVSSFKLFPRHAQLGNVIYDQSNTPITAEVFGGRTFLDSGSVSGVASVSGSETYSPRTFTGGVGTFNSGHYTYDASLLNLDVFMNDLNGESAPTDLPSVRTLFYRSICSVNTGYDNSIPWATANSNGWLLKDSTGALIYNSGFTSNNIGDISNPSFSTYLANHVISMAQAHGYKGIWFDDGVAQGSRLVNHLPAGWTDTDWHTNMVAHIGRVGDIVKAAGLEMVVNANGYISGDSNSDSGTNDLTFWGQIAAHVTGLTSEYWEENPNADSNVRLTGTSLWYNNWDGWRRLHGFCNTNGIDFIPLSYYPGGSSEFNYLYGSFLLDYQGTGSAILLGNNATPYPVPVNLGHPLDSATQSPTGVWTRHFSNVTVTVNTNTGTATIA